MKVMARQKMQSPTGEPTPDARDRYAALVADLIKAPGVSQSVKKGFGFSGLLIGGKLFAVPRGDELLLKLPAPKVAALIVSRDGTAFDAGRGRPMKEWVTVKATSKERWLDLARQAMQFVATARA